MPNSDLNHTSIQKLLKTLMPKFGIHLSAGYCHGLTVAIDEAILLGQVEELIQAIKLLADKDQDYIIPAIEKAKAKDPIFRSAEERLLAEVPEFLAGISAHQCNQKNKFEKIRPQFSKTSWAQAVTQRGGVLRADSFLTVCTKQELVKYFESFTKIYAEADEKITINLTAFMSGKNWHLITVYWNNANKAFELFNANDPISAFTARHSYSAEQIAHQIFQALLYRYDQNHISYLVCWTRLYVLGERSVSAMASIKDWLASEEMRSIREAPPEEKIAWVNRSYGSGLLASSYVGDLQQVKTWLGEAGINPNIEQSDGTRALHFAVQGNHPEVVNYLLASGAQATAANSNGTTALHLAARDGRSEIASSLLIAGADVQATTVGGGNTALHYAAMHSHIELVDQLIATGADVCKVNASGKTAAQLVPVTCPSLIYRLNYMMASRDSNHPDDNNNTPTARVASTAAHASFRSW